MIDPQEQALYDGGWTQHKGRWWPTAETMRLIRAATRRLSAEPGYSLDDAVQINTLMRAQKRKKS